MIGAPSRHWLLLAGLSRTALLLSALAGCSTEYIDATAVHLAVYSDAQLSRVDVVVLTELEQPTTMTQSFVTPHDVHEPTAFLFDMVVARGAQSTNRTSAVVRFDGYVDGEGGPMLVVRRTVRAPFSDQTTRFGRVLLARSCVVPYGQEATCPSEGFSCSPVSGSCESHGAPLFLEPFAKSDDQRARTFFTDYPRCGDASDGICPNQCALGEDLDCRHELGKVCAADAECKSELCASACSTPPCQEKRCSSSRCDEPCTYVDNTGSCIRFDFESDPKNCGGCAATCGDAHANASCQGRRCVESCHLGFGDCNGVPADGCEAEFATDVTHCGGCGSETNRCHYGVCEQGKCLGTRVPSASKTGARSFAAGDLYLTFVPLVAARIEALGIEVAADSAGSVTLVLAADADGEPGELLFSGQAQLRATDHNARNEQYGTEVVVPPDIEVKSGFFWIGFVLHQTTVLTTADRPPFVDRRLGRVVEPYSLSALPALSAVDTSEPSPSSDPVVYAVSFKRGR